MLPSDERTWEVLIRTAVLLVGAGHILHSKWTCGSLAISPLSPICVVPSMASTRARPGRISRLVRGGLEPAPSCVRQLQLQAHPLACSSCTTTLKTACDAAPFRQMQAAKGSSRLATKRRDPLRGVKPLQGSLLALSHRITVAALRLAVRWDPGA